MDILKASKKLEEIKVDAYNNLSSGEEESELQLHSATEVPNEDSAAGEEVKPERTKAENVKEYKTLSRTTPMDGKTRAKPEVYLNEEGEKVKKTTSEEIWAKLEELKKRSTPKDILDQYSNPDSIDEDTASMLHDLGRGTNRKLYEDAVKSIHDYLDELVNAELGDVLFEAEEIKDMLRAFETLGNVFVEVKFNRGPLLVLLNSMGELE